MMRLDNNSTSWLLRHFTDNSTLAIVSLFSSERSECENMALHRRFRIDVRHKLRLGFTELKSRWVETDPDTGEMLSADERSLIVYNISLKNAIAYGQKFQQSSIIFKNDERCFVEVCTTEFTDYEGKNHHIGDIVRTLKTIDNPNAFNMQDVKDMFEDIKGGLGSFPIKSNRPFGLAEMFEVEGPSATTFSEKERYLKLL